MKVKQQNTNKRVLHLGKFYSPEYGGIESVTQILAEGITSSYQVRVICFTQLQRKMTKDTINEVSVIRYPVFIAFLSQPLSFSYFLQCIKQSRQVDIIHIHTPNLLATAAAFFIPRSKKIVVHWHSDILNKGWMGKLVQPIEKWLLKRADKTIVTTNQYIEGSKLLKTVLDKISIIPIGIEDLSQFATTELDDSKLKEFIQNKQVVLSIGRLVPYKGFKYLIDSARFLDKHKVIVIVGAGKQRVELSEMIIDLNLSHKVYLAGKLSMPDLQAMYRLADIFCLASVDRAEAFGIVLLEAMSFGLPVVATRIDCSGVSWVNQHGFSGLNVAVKDSKALSRVFNNILDNNQLYDKLSRGSKDRYQSEFTQQKFIENILELYNSLGAVLDN